MMVLSFNSLGKWCHVCQTGGAWPCFYFISWADETPDDDIHAYAEPTGRTEIH